MIDDHGINIYFTFLPSRIHTEIYKNFMKTEGFLIKKKSFCLKKLFEKVM